MRNVEAQDWELVVFLACNFTSGQNFCLHSNNFGEMNEISFKVFNFERYRSSAPAGKEFSYPGNQALFILRLEAIRHQAGTRKQRSFSRGFSVVTSYTRMYASAASNQLPTCKSGDTAAVSSLQDSRGAGRTRNLVFLQALQETKNATERFLVPKGSERVSLPLIQFTRFYAI